MSAYLLDVNVLLALSDPKHVHHEIAHQWFARVGQAAWATCPITENGYVRIASHPRYPSRPGDVSAVMTMLRTLCSRSGHSFWADTPSIRDLVAPDAVVTSAHLTDVYLLGLAVAYGGWLATLDHSIPKSVIDGGAAALAVIDRA